jgi:hypothetical protein
MQVNTKAIAKFVVNKRLNTLRLLVTFDTASGRVTQRNAAFATGDLCDVGYARAQEVMQQALAQAESTLRTGNIVLVD